MKQGCKLIKIGDATAIICGSKPNHVCNEDLVVFDLKDGSRIEDTPENRERYYHDVIGGSVACSICGRAFMDNVMRESF